MNYNAERLIISDSFRETHKNLLRSYLNTVNKLDSVIKWNDRKKVPTTES